MKKIKKFLCIAIAFAFIFVGCKKTGSAANGNTAYVKDNTAQISETALENGIKLIVKKQATNRIYSIRVNYNGGNALTPDGKDGIESLTLSTMLTASKNYPHDDIEQILHETTSNMGSGSGLDMSWATFNTLDKYWDKASDVFFDCLVNPLFDDGDFEVKVKDANAAWVKDSTDQMTTTIDSLLTKSRAGHPYGKFTVPTDISLKNISLNDVKTWHAEKLTADRMVVVAVGNFDVNKLKTQLNKTLGKIPVKNNVIPEIPPMNLKSTLYTQEFPTANGMANIRGDYEIPNRHSPDFTKLQLAYSILDELAFAIVRTDHGACYSIWAGIHGFNQSYGSLVIYRTQKPSEAKRYFDEAIAVLASGKSLKLKDDGDDSTHYVPLAETLDAYKAKFINDFFSAQYANAAIAGQIASNYYYHSDPTAYLKVIEEINSTTPEDIVRVVNQYLVNAKVSWMVCSDNATLQQLDQAAFSGFTGSVQK